MAGASLSNWISQPKNRMIAVVGGVLVLVIIAVVVVMMMSGGGGSSNGTSSATTAGSGGAGGSGGSSGFPAGGSAGIVGQTGMSGGGAAPMAVGTGGVAGTGSGSGSAAAGGAGGAKGAAAGAGPGEPKKVASAAVPSRSDPFQYNSELRGLYGEMRPLFTEPVVLPPAHVDQWYELYKPPHGREEGNEDVVPNLPVPPMRVAGIHNGNVVSAILEVQGQVQPPVVPGAKVLNDFRVDRIERDKVVLSRKVPGYTRPQIVEVGMEGPSQLSGRAPAMPGGPTMPGMSGGPPPGFTGGTRPPGKMGTVGAE